ncbi:hypothetical protein GCM10010166_03870 [Couchioplanes caeruleus subsp. azureus]|nr:hypothetical protein GCM10010166_03870 [Couchioplanes caeruleus subsp. azureus]
MTVDVSAVPEGQVIGFNGTAGGRPTTWLPREDQLRRTARRSVPVAAQSGAPLRSRSHPPG